LYGNLEDEVSKILRILLLLSLPAAATAQTIRVNAGGPVYHDTKGQTWSADYGFNSGTLSNTAPASTVTGTTDPTLFKSARVAPTSGTQLQYQYAVANGTYTVNLYFAETYFSSAHQRVFDVQMQGATVISALDIFAQAGFCKALVKSAKVSVTNGQLVIGFIRTISVPVVSALEILPAATTSTAPGITTQPASTSVAPGQAATFKVVATGTAPLSYQWQKNGSAISGATAASYTTPATTSADNGETFRVVVKNSVGSVTSNSATLSVGSNTNSGTTVTINWSDVHQVIDGFGASDAFTGFGITDAQADLFFSTTKGVGLSLLRIDVQPDGTYPDLATMQKAQARGAKIWGAPWTPPASMKTNQSTTNGGSLLAADYQPYANYLANYLSTLKNSYGINLFALSVQNEPNWTANWETCIWSAQNIHDFLGNLHSALVAKGLNPQVVVAESAQWTFDLVTPTLNDPTTAADVSIIAAHDYNGVNASPYPTAQAMGKHLWQSEMSSFESFDPGISNGLRWANTIHGFMTVANTNAWHYWHFIPEDSLNSALLGPSGQTTKRLFVMGNYSKFVRPGYYRIGATGGQNNVSVSAYKDPNTGKFAIVAISNALGSVNINFAFSGFTATSVVPWVTSATLDLVQQPAIPVYGNIFGVTLPPQSVTTFVGP
jgi:glucuronoarabinoxylan endo-1,4-beta-xylanase